MKIEIDDKSGFCFGVVKAITKAEESLASGEKVYSLGDTQGTLIPGSPARLMEMV